MKSGFRFCLTVLTLLVVLVAGALAQTPRIVFSRIGPSRIGLFVSRADGSDERPLLKSEGLDYNPSWSRDGEWIIFTSERNGSADLYRVKPDGTGLEQLTDDPAYDDQAAFSPDGKQIVFVSTRASGRANLWTLNLRTRNAKPLTTGRGGDFRPSWSPDGRWIAFSSDRDSTLPMAKGRWEHLQLADIYLIHPDGSGLKRFTGHGNFCGSPKWSADGRRVIAYCMSAEETWTYRGRPPRPGFPLGGPTAEGDSRLVSIDMATGDTADVAAGPGVKVFPVILASGEVAYVRQGIRVRGVFYGLGKPGPVGAVGSPSWSPDGAHVVYHKVLSNETPAWQKAFSRDPLYELILTRWLPAFDPSGEQIAAMQDGTGDLVLIRTGTNASRTLFHQEGKSVMAAQWSPKGDAIIFGLGVFFQGLSKGTQVAMINPDGSGFRQLTSDQNNNGFPSMAPDGKRFVFRTTGPAGQGLRIMNLEDHSVSTLTTEYDNFPLWSPKGDLIIFVRKYKGDFEIFSIRPDGRDLRRLTYSPGNEGHLAWSPDGEWILFSSARMGFKDEALYTDSPQPYGELFMMRYDGTHVRQLTDNQWEDATPAWQPEPRPKR